VHFVVLFLILVFLVSTIVVLTGSGTTVVRLVEVSCSEHKPVRVRKEM
jgi:hypothetical protein